MVIMVKQGKKTTKYVLGVLPGDLRIDLNAVKRLLDGTYAAFASREVAEKLSGCTAGTILPFTFDSVLELIVDPQLLDSQTVYFNAARLDRSIALRVSDYLDNREGGTHLRWSCWHRFLVEPRSDARYSKSKIDRWHKMISPERSCRLVGPERVL